MNESKVSPGERNEIRTDAPRQARAETEQELGREILDIFRELLQRLWERLAALIGEMATATIFDAAKREAARDHPFLNEVKVNAKGIHLERLQENLSSLDRTEVRRGLFAFMDNVIALITDLTGDILVRKLQPLVQGFRQELEKE